MAGKGRQFLLLLWKNYLLQKRKVVVTVIEIALPALFALILIFIRQRVVVNHVDNSTIWESFKLDDLPSDLKPTPDWINFRYQTRESTAWRLFYYPNSSLAQSVMQRVKNRLGPRSISDVVGYSNEEKMTTHLIDMLEEAQSNSTYICDVLAAIVFDNLNDSSTPSYQYKIRLPSSPRNAGSQKLHFNPMLGDTRWNTEFMFPLFQRVGPREPKAAKGGDPGYFREGFLTLQYHIDLSLMQMTSPNISTADLDISEQRFPYPPYLDDNFVLVNQQQLPLILMLSFVFCALHIVKDVVHEKERKLKESMKMMGLSGWLHWLAWFVKYYAFLLISVLIMTTLFCIPVNGLRVIGYTHPTVLLVYLMAYAAATVCFCFMVSVFFKKANTAAAAGGILFFIAFIPYSFLQPRYSTLPWGAKVAAGLISNVAMAFGGQVIGMFEGTGAGVQWSTINKPATVDDTFTLLHVILLLLFDALLYSLVTWYVEAIFPGEYGLPQPWYFPFMKSYWCGTIPKDTLTEYESLNDITERTPLLAPSASGQDLTTSVNGIYFEDDPVGLKAGISIANLRKEFGNGTAKNVAVEGMTLNMYEGQITALLGHNGAGKTTTMSMLTGFLPPTSGTAAVNGFDIRRDIASVRQSLGLCPQHDVLFDTLTVREHLVFFAKLKGMSGEQVDTEVDSMLTAVGLQDKRYAQAKTLSGGMKRRLSMAIALVGGSKVVILDEPTSGMDPNARRQAWDILLQQRAGRTLVLTTHFMDEADVLGDRIAIMADGQLQCCGSPLYLKHKYGAGYHLVLVKQSDKCDVAKVTAFITSHVTEARLDSHVSAELTYVLPHECKEHFEHMFTELEKRREELGIASYGASVTTMEEVFLRVAERTEKAVLKKQEAQELENDQSQPAFINPTNKNSGVKLYMQQFWGMFVKRMLHTWRNRLVTLSQLVVPLFFTIMALIVLKTMPSPEDSPPLTLNLSKFEHNYVPYRNDNDTLSKEIADLYASQFKGSDSVVQKVTSGTMNDYLEKKGEESVSVYNVRYLIAGDFNTVNDTETNTTKTTARAHFNNQAYHTPAMALNALTNALLKHVSGSDNASISAINHPLPRTVNEKISDQMTQNFEGFTVSFNVLFGMAFLASSFVIFLIKERSTGAKHCQFVSGVHTPIFWASTFCWDFINFLVPSLLLLVVFWGFDIQAYVGGLRVFDLLLLFMLYGWAILPFMYLMSFIFSVPASGLVWLTMLNILSGVATILAVDILSIPQLGTQSVAQVLEWVFLVLLPNFCLGQGMTDFYDNHMFLQACDNDLVHELCKMHFVLPCCRDTCGNDCAYYNHNYLGWAPSGIGRYLTFLCLQGFIYWAILLLIDTSTLQTFLYMLQNGSTKRGKKHRRNLSNGSATIIQEDSDVAAERRRILETPLSQLRDSLVLKELSKDYGRVKAVDSLTVGMMPGECFGLLGINGAGKTTTFRMLTGDEIVTSGNAWLDCNSIRSDIRKVHRRLGYCPQFDALIDQMTGRETLTMFARLRGVRENYIAQCVKNLLKTMMLEKYADRLVNTYSGGNKRKLSTAVSLIGDPPVVFLDEPSTGMDPVAKRQLWNTLSQVRASGRMLVLTSHSMEECEALCTRIAIMVNGQMKCLGSPQHLKNKFGEGYTLIAKVGFPQGGGSPDVESLMNYISSAFPGCVLKDVHQGMIHYHITDTSVSLATLFGTVEKVKERFNIEDYSVSQTTLEQVFINFARAQEAPVESTNGCLARCCLFCCCCCRGCCHSNEELVSLETSQIVSDQSNV